MGNDFVGVPITIPAPSAAVTPPKVELDPVLLGGQFTFSGYGEFIPLIYGSFIVTGNVFWQSPWKQNTYVNKSTSPPTTIVTNYCDFAVGLCEGEIDDVLRIWVGDELIFDKRVDVDENDVPVNASGRRVVRSASGGVRVTTYLPGAQEANTDEEISVGLTSSWTVCKGGEYQLPPDKMIAEEGYEFTPGYRGTAFLLFENYFQNDTTAPEIRVEVVANSQSRVARKFVEFPDNALWDEVNKRLVFDPILSVIYSVTEGVGLTPFEDGGFVSVDALTLEPIADHRFYDFVPDLTFGGADVPRPETVCATLFGGNLLIGGFDSNNGFLFTANPWAQSGIDTIIRTGAGTNHEDDGPTAPGAGTIVFPYIEDDENPVQAVAVTAFANGLNHIGFARIDSDNNISWHGYLNGVLAQDDGGLGDDTVAKLVEFTVDEEFALTYPTFPDGARTEGQHIYAFTVYSIPTPSQSLAFHVDRVTLRDPPPITEAELLDFDTNRASIDNPKHTYIGEISLDQVGGAPIPHTIIHSFVDPVDRTVVMTLSVDSAYDPFADRIIKWSPWTGELVYSKPLAARLPLGAASGSANALIGQDRKWAYPSPDDKIVLVDLKTGDSEVVVTNTITEGLGDMASAVALQYSVWLGDEGGLIIPLTEALGADNLVKVWPLRRGPAKASLRAIVVDLLTRAGWDPALIQFTTAVDSILVTGYVIDDKQDVRTSLAELKQVFGFDVIESSGAIQYVPRGGDAVATIPYEHLKQDDNGSLIEVIDTDIARLRKVEIKYFDIDRDYAENVQQVVLPEIGEGDFTAEGYIDVDIPLVLTADEAKILAEGLAYQKQVYETNYQFALPPKYLTLDPGDVIEIEEENATLKMRVRNTDRGADKEIRVEAATEDPDIYNDTVDLFTEAGRFESATIPDDNPIVFFKPLNIPHLSDNDGRIANGTLAYRMFWFDMNPIGADVSFDRRWQLFNDGVEFGLTTPNPNRPTWGYARQTPRINGGMWHPDTDSEVIVFLGEEGLMTPTTVAGGTAALLDDALINLCYLNGELFQFATATLNGDGSYTLTNLIRARCGTEIAAQSHSGGGLFVMLADQTGSTLNPAVVDDIALPLPDGPRKRLRAVLQADDTSPLQPETTVTFEATNLKPFAPTFPQAVESAGDLILSWIRRERFVINDDWPENGDEDVPVATANDARPGEYTTRWELFLTDTPWTGFGVPPTFLRNVTVTDAETWTYTAAMQTEDSIDISADTLYGYVRHSGGKTGNETGWPCKFTIEPGA